MIIKKDLYYCYSLRIHRKLEENNCLCLGNGLSKPSKSAEKYGLNYGIQREFWIYEKTNKVISILEQDKKEKEKYLN
ncbi:MAG: hypothetical protein ACRCX8_08615 [Sarcina sp.]